MSLQSCGVATAFANAHEKKQTPCIEPDMSKSPYDTFFDIRREDGFYVLGQVRGAIVLENAHEKKQTP